MGIRPGGTPERPAIFFDTADDFRGWLAANHATATELWMGLRRKHVPERGLTWEQAVPEALCYGWIDSVGQRIDDDSTRQRWTPRKPRSNWSKVNIALAEQLIAEGRMQPSGLAAFERRTAERSGIYSYELVDEEEFPLPLAAQLRANPAAAAFFYETATSSYRRAAIRWVLAARRPETVAKRMADLISDSEARRLIRPMRYGEPPKWATGQ